MNLNALFHFYLKSYIHKVFNFAQLSTIVHKKTKNTYNQEIRKKIVVEEILINQRERLIT